MTKGILTVGPQSKINLPRLLLLLILFWLLPPANAQAATGGAVASANVALASNGATATASSTYSDGRFNVASVIDGDRGSAWGVPQHPGWSDATYSRYPDWVQVNFSGPKTIDTINVFTLQDDHRLGQPITKTETFSQWGIQNFTVRYRQNGSWVTIPNGSVTNNNLVWREFIFSPITTDAVRVTVTRSLQFYSRIQEVEVWEVGAPPVNTSASYQVGVNYHSTSSNFTGDNFIRDYHEPAVRSRVLGQLQGMAAAGADILKLFMWFVGDQEYFPAERWRLAFPISSQEVANLQQYLTDVAPLTSRNGRPISVSLTFAWLGCADYQRVVGGRYGWCGLTWSQLTSQAKQTVDSALQVAGAVRRPDGSRVVSTVYLEAEVMIGAKPNESRFLRDVYPYFVQQAQAAGVLPSLYFLIEAYDQTVLDDGYVDSSYPILNGHGSLYWVYRSIDFLQREGLLVPERLDVSIYPEANTISYDESLRLIFDDIAEVFPGKRVAVVETYYPVDQAERRRLGQGLIAEAERRSLLEAVIFWTTPNAGRNGEGVGYPFDFDSYRPASGNSVQDFGPISASPNPCPAPGGGTPCTTAISWDAGRMAQIRVSENGQPETPYACGASGSQLAPWIQSGHTYVFKLYYSQTCSVAEQVGAPVGMVTVRGQSTCGAITVNPPAIPNGFVGASYNQTFTQSGGVAPVTFSSTGTLPPGLTLNPMTGVLSGAPTQANPAQTPFSFTITVTDANGCAGSATYTLAILPACATISLSPAAGALAAGKVGTAYSQTFTQSGGVAPVTFSSTGTLPPGLTLNPATGVLSGAPTQASQTPFSFTITATGANGCTGNAAYTLAILPACATISLSPAAGALTAGRVGTAYSRTFTRSGGVAPVAFSSTGTLPPGLTLNPATGVLSGAPAQASQTPFTFTITATDANGCAGSATYTLVINPAITTGGGLMYYPLPTPVRLLNTRPGSPACNAPGAPLPGDQDTLLIARGACTGVPASALAIVGNATVVNANPSLSSGGHVTLYPSNAPRPDVSNLNFTANQIVANAFTVRLGGDGGFKIYTFGATHFIVDITGYYAPPGAGGLYYHPLPAPVRLLDTRPGSPACNAPSAPLPGGSDTLQIARGACAGVPTSALAIVGNATVVNANPSLSNSGHVTLYPSDVSPRPDVSNLNFIANQIVPNAFTVRLGGDGGFKIYTFGATHFIVDITGYYSAEAADANGAGLLYNPRTEPLRLLDTRPGSPACNAPGASLLGGADTLLIVRGACAGAPTSALAIVGNATVVNANPSLSGGGHVTLYPSNAPRPDVSNLNFTANQIVANAFTVRLGGDGGLKIYTFGSTHFILDLAGYFAP
jgi:hypothetical protein